MEEHNETPACSVNLCENKATEEEHGDLPHWRVTIHYCREHARELEQGTPIGPLGIDPARVRIEPHGTAELRVPSKQPSPSA